VVVLPGNHDEFLREYLGTYFGEVEFVDRTVHTTAQGRTYLVMHGDQFRYRRRQRPNGWRMWVTGPIGWRCRPMSAIKLGGAGRLHRPYWSLSAWAKHKVKNAGERDRPLRGSADARGAGHRPSTASSVAIFTSPTCTTVSASTISTPATGVESCTAVCETPEGQFELIKWIAQTPVKPKVPRERRMLNLRRRAKSTPDLDAPAP